MDLFDTNGVELGDGPTLTRRQALSGLGFAGLLGIGGNVLSSADHEVLEPWQAGWTARHRQRVEQHAWEGGFDRYEPTSLTDDVVFAGEKYSSLQYLGASWSPYGSPASGSGADGDGAWRHTFLLNNFVAMLSATDRAQLTEGGVNRWQLVSDPSYELGDAFSVMPSITVEAAGDGDASAPSQPDIAVSAVRDRDLFGFVDPSSFETELEDTVAESDGVAADVQAYLDSIATSDGPKVADWNDVLQTVRDVEDTRQNWEATAGAAEAMLLLAIASTGPAAGAVVSLYSLAKIAADLFSGTEQREPPVGFYEGFEQAFPEQAAGSVGSGFVLFDVYVGAGSGADAPSGAVDITTETTVTSSSPTPWEEATLGSTWTVEVEGKPPRGTASLTTAETFNARISDFTTTLDLDQPGWAEGDRGGSYFVDRSPTHGPQPTITPPPEVATPPAEPPDPLTQGETYEFSAHETLYGGADVESYSWSIDDPGAAEGAYDDVDGDVVLEQEIADTDANHVTVSLAVTDAADVTETASEQFPIGEGHADITPKITRVDPETNPTPVAGDTVYLTGLESEVAAGVDTYRWYVSSFPATFPRQAKRYHQSGVGEQFLLPTLVTGEYDVTLEVTDEIGRTASTSRTFTVGESDPAAEIVEPGGDLVPRDQPVTLRVEHTGFRGTVPAENVTWRVDGEDLEVTGREVTHTFTQPDEAVVVIEATVVGPNGEAEATTDYLVTVEDEVGDLLIDIQGSRRPQLERDLQYRAETVGARGSVDYRWSVTVPQEGAELPADSGFKRFEPPRESGLNDAGSITGSFASAGERLLEVVASDGEGNTGQDSLVVDAGMQLEVSLDAPESIRPGEAVTFSASAEDAAHEVTYTWDGDVSGTGPELEVTFEEFGWVDVEVLATEIAPTGQQATASERIFVDDVETVDIEVSPEPVAPDEEVELTANVAGTEGAPDFRWDLPDDADFGLSSQSGMIHPRTITGTFGAEGSHEVSVTAQDGQDGDVVSTTTAVDVWDLDVDIDGPTRVDVNEAVTLSADVTGAESDVTYTWGGDVDGTGAEIDLQFSDPGSKTVELAVEETGGDGERATATETVVVDDVDAVEIVASSDPVAPGSEVTLTAEVSQVEGTSEFRWTLPDDAEFGLSSVGGMIHPREITGTFESAGEKDLSVAMRDSRDGDLAQGTYALSVDEPLSVDIDAPSRIDHDESPTITATVAGADGDVAYTWSGDVDATGSEIQPTFDSPGSKTVRVEARETGDDGERATASAELTVDDPDRVSIERSSSRVAPGEAVTLTAQVSGVEGSPSYRWTLPDDADFGLSTVGGMIHPRQISGSFGSAGSKTVSVTAQDGRDGDLASDETTITVDTPLSVALSADDASVRTGESVSFDTAVSGANGDVDYEWSVGELSGSSPERSWSSAGTYEVRVTVDDGMDTASDAVEVDVSPSLDVEIDGPTALEPGESGSYTAEVSNAVGSLDYRWTIEGGDFGLSSTGGMIHPRSVSGAFSSEGSKTISVTAQDGRDGAIASDEITVSVDEPIDVALSADDTSVRTDDAVSFDTAVSGANGDVDYEWSVGELSGSSPERSWSSAGTYEVRVTVDDGTDTTSDAVEVDVSPSLDVDIDGPTALEPDETAEYTADVGNAVGSLDYRWTIEGGDFGLSSTGGMIHPRSVSGSFGSEGSKTISVTAQDGRDGTIASDEITVSVDEPIDVALSADDTSVRTSESVSFDTALSGANGDVDYEWSVGDLSGSSTERSWSSAGTYEVRVTADDGTETASDSVTIDVSPSLSVDIDGPRDLEPGESAEYTADVSNADGSLDYRWTIEGGDFGLSSTGGMIHPRSITGSFDSEGSKTVRVAAQDGRDGTIASDELSVSVDEPISVDLSADDTSVRTGETVRFEADTDHANGSVDFDWDGASGSGSSISDSFGSAGTKRVTVTADDGSSSDADSVTVDVTAPEPDPSVSIGTPTTGSACSGGYEVSASVSDADSPVSYDWYLDGSSIGSGRTVGFSVATNGDRTLRVEIEDDDGDTASATKTFYACASTGGF